MSGRVRVVGLGPGDAALTTPSATDALVRAPVARLRTHRHPAAEPFQKIESYDALYEAAKSFDSLYDAIVSDLVRLATEHGEVVYAVPGSPSVAERTVELLREQQGIELTVEPAVSVIDVALSEVGCDPVTDGLRIVDALGAVELLAGPGPLLILQTYSPEVMAALSSRLPASTPVRVLHHLGLPDAEVLELTAYELSQFGPADHLTSVWVPHLRTAGVAIDELLELTRTLRAKCVWDQEQDHVSLLPHLTEEAYEALDALAAYAAADGQPSPDHVVEELGDLLFQIAFHAELGSEENQFTFVDVADAVRTKLISRHPHVFEGVEVQSADDAAVRWEILKQSEKGRLSVTDGVPANLPSLTLLAKMSRKAASVGIPPSDVGVVRSTIIETIRSMSEPREDELTVLISAVAALVAAGGIDMEGAVRAHALALRNEIRHQEGLD